MLAVEVIQQSQTSSTLISSIDFNHHLGCRRYFVSDRKALGGREELLQE
jgi:hypothetical protein